MSLNNNLDATEPRLLPELCVADNIMAVNNFIEKEEKKKRQKTILDENEVKTKEKEEGKEEKKYLRLPVLARQTNAPPGWEPCQEELMADANFKYFKQERE